MRVQIFPVMKRTLFSTIFTFSMIMALGQQSATDALKPDSQTLRERYLLMKTKSETYQDYNVIKKTTLDGMWRIVEDSVRGKQAIINQSRAEINKLQTDLDNKIEALKTKEDSMKDIEYASTHITVLGIDFSKGFFAGMVGVLLLVAGMAVAAVVYSMNVIRRNLAEKEDLANTISQEYEDYKRKAMDKQTKLSRELQNERNKLQELGSL